MDVNIENSAWDNLTYAEKNKQLFLKQKQTLEMFLERGAISQAQHDKSLRKGQPRRRLGLDAGLQERLRLP